MSRANIFFKEMKYILLIVFYHLSLGYSTTLYGYNLYHTNRSLNNLDRDCLYYFPDPIQYSYQFIQYCFRHSRNEEKFNVIKTENSFTFEELEEKTITSAQLYES